MARVREARALVENLLGQVAAEVNSLPGPALRAMAPVLHQAEQELSRDLAKWLRTVENGAERFTAQQLRVALVQMRGALRTMKGLNPALFDVLMQANGDAGHLALGHLARQAERFSMLFEGSIRPMPIQPAAVLAKGDRLLIRRFRASSARYGEWAATEIQRQLAVGVVRGETFDQMIRRLQRINPTARAAAGLVKGPGETAESIAQALGHRISNRAELIVRTEVIHAYNAHAYDGIAAAAAEDPDYRMRWDAAADSRLCPWCRSLDGKVAKVDEEFERGVKHPPLHPRCRCALTPWHVDWGESPALGAPVRHGQGPTEEELAAAAAAEQERVRAAQQAVKPKPAKLKPVKPAPPTPSVEKRVDIVGPRRVAGDGWSLESLADAIERDPSSAVPMLKRMMADVNGSHGGRLKSIRVEDAFNMGWDGAMAFSKKGLDRVAHVMREIDAGVPSTADDLEYLKCMLHEFSHSVSPMTSAGYRGVGVVLEEATTEAAAQSAIRKIAGIGRGSIMVSYRGWPTGMASEIARLAGVGIERGWEMLESASMELRSGRWGVMESASEVAEALSGIVFPEDAAKAEQFATFLRGMR